MRWIYNENDVTTLVMRSKDERKCRPTETKVKMKMGPAVAYIYLSHDIKAGMSGLC